MCCPAARTCTISRIFSFENEMLRNFEDADHISLYIYIYILRFKGKKKKFTYLIIFFSTLFHPSWYVDILVIVSLIKEGEKEIKKPFSGKATEIVSILRNFDSLVPFRDDRVENVEAFG